MSAKVNRYDNACAERFFGSLKVAWVFRTRFQMREAVFEYIGSDDSLQRRPSLLGHISLEAFKARMGA